MAEWRFLVEYLSGVNASVTLSWRELEHLVPGLPPEARTSAFWDSADSPIGVCAAAGFRLTSINPGYSLTFTKVATRAPAMPPRNPGLTPATVSLTPIREGLPEMVLVGCTRVANAPPWTARTLSEAGPFASAARSAQAQGLPWFLVTADHGLLRPDELLGGVERTLSHVSNSYRRAWAGWVAERLDLLAGPILGRRIAIAATHRTIVTLSPALVGKGALVVQPANPEETGPIPRITPRQAVSTTATSGAQRDLAAIVRGTAPLPPYDLAADPRPDLDRPGLVAWWVDTAGALDLSRGLGHPVPDGLVYVETDVDETNARDLLVRALNPDPDHQSLWRLSLSASLAPNAGYGGLDDAALTAWMSKHLRVAIVPEQLPGEIAAMQRDTVRRLDPALNIKWLSLTPLRLRLKGLRRPFLR